MKLNILAAVFLIGLATPAIVLAQQPQFQDEQDAVARARAAYRAALKSHDKAAIAKTSADLRAAAMSLTQDRQSAAAAATAPMGGETRDAQLALVKAREDHKDALASGDPAAIKRTAAALRAAAHNDWVSRHAKHAPKA